MTVLYWLEGTAFSDWVLTSRIGFPLMLNLHAVALAGPGDTALARYNPI
ncbi:MAG: hypothetical protein V3T47_09810 [Gammaproteobacteria bacterium]